MTPHTWTMPTSIPAAAMPCTTVWMTVSDIPDTVAGLFDELLIRKRWMPVSVLDIAEVLPPPDIDVTLVVSPWPKAPTWHEQAACATAHPETDADPIFFGVDDVERPALPPQAVEAARAICDVCPSRAQCLLWALTENERFGIWGGTTGRQRSQARKALREGRVTVATLLEVYA